MKRIFFALLVGFLALAAHNGRHWVRHAPTSPLIAQATQDRLAGYLPFQICNDVRALCEGQPECLQYAINVQYQLQTHTRATAIILLMSLYDYTHSQMVGHAMVLFFLDGKVYVADQNEAVTEVNLDKVNWKLGDEGVAEEAFHSHLKDSDEAGAMTVMYCKILTGKADVSAYFGPSATGYFQHLGHLNYFPWSYCED